MDVDERRWMSRTVGKSKNRAEKASTATKKLEEEKGREALSCVVEAI